MTITCLKFRPISKYLIESLVNSTIYFAKPSELNDPFDCRIDVQRVLEEKASISLDDQKMLFNELLNKPNFIQNWEKVIENIGVFSSSIDAENSIKQTLLWSHYANEHKGVCLKYEFPSEFLNKNQFKTYVGGQVNYLSELSTDSLHSDTLDIHKIIVSLMDIVLRTKRIDWKYENEYRIINETYGSVDIKKEYLKSIYFGIATTKADINLVKKLADTYSICNDFFQMDTDKSFFGFDVKQI